MKSRMSKLIKTHHQQTKQGVSNHIKTHMKLLLIKSNNLGKMRLKMTNKRNLNF